MGNAVPKEATASLRERGLFYKCPIGGFASLRPGICSKCHESLTPIIVVGDRDGHSGNGGANMRGALVAMHDGTDFS